MHLGYAVESCEIFEYERLYVVFSQVHSEAYTGQHLKVKKVRVLDGFKAPLDLRDHLLVHELVRALIEHVDGKIGEELHVDISPLDEYDRVILLTSRLLPREEHWGGDLLWPHQVRRIISASPSNIRNVDIICTLKVTTG